MALLFSLALGGISLVFATFAVLLWRDGNRNGWTDGHVMDGSTFTVIAMLTALFAILIGALS